MGANMSSGVDLQKKAHDQHLEASKAEKNAVSNEQQAAAAAAAADNAENSKHVWQHLQRDWRGERPADSEKKQQQQRRQKRQDDRWTHRRPSAEKPTLGKVMIRR